MRKSCSDVLNKIWEMYDTDRVPTPYFISRGLGYKISGRISKQLKFLEQNGYTQRIDHGAGLIEIMPLKKEKP